MKKNLKSENISTQNILNNDNIPQQLIMPSRSDSIEISNSNIEAEQNNNEQHTKSNVNNDNIEVNNHHEANNVKQNNNNNNKAMPLQETVTTQSKEGVPNNTNVNKSLLSNPQNPRTQLRKSLEARGIHPAVSFDERVVVHSVAYWDPNGDTFSDDEDENIHRRPPACCICM